MKTTYLLTLLPKPSGFPAADITPSTRAEEPGNMAPVPVESSPSYIPTAVVGAHLFSIVYLSLVASRTIYRSYLALPPSSATRHREPLRRVHIKTFSILALVSLTTAALFGVKFALLSYRIWATERGVELPENLFGDHGAFRAGEHPGRFHLVRWLNDTPFYRDSLEIVAEKARHFWWGQQVNLGLISWSTYLALEGQRRKISYLWAFLALAKLVSLSYAQNLFFVAVLLTPVPLPGNVRDLTRSSVPVTSSRYSHLLDRIIPRKQDGFLPKPAFYISLLLASFTTVFLIPYAANTTSFVNVSWITGVLPFSFLLLPHVVPAGWGSVSSHPHGSHSTYTSLFRIILALSAALHLKSTVLALFHNTPDSTYHRHSVLHPFKEEHRSALGRGSTAIGRVFGAMGEHPAVGSIAWDVLLTGLSLGIWAAVRGLDGTEILNSSMVFMKGTTNNPSEGLDSTLGSITAKTETSVSKKGVTTDQPRRGPGRPKKTDVGKKSTTQDRNISQTARRRPATKSTDFGKGRGNDEYYPPDGERFDEGDEDTEEDLEIAALVWGLLSAGGLGTGSAAVYGAEATSR